MPRELQWEWICSTLNHSNSQLTMIKCADDSLTENIRHVLYYTASPARCYVINHYYRLYCRGLNHQMSHHTIFLQYHSVHMFFGFAVRYTAIHWNLFGTEYIPIRSYLISFLSDELTAQYPSQCHIGSHESNWCRYSCHAIIDSALNALMIQ